MTTPSFIVKLQSRKFYKSVAQGRNMMAAIAKITDPEIRDMATNLNDRMNNYIGDEVENDDHIMLIYRNFHNRAEVLVLDYTLPETTEYFETLDDALAFAKENGCHQPRMLSKKSHGNGYEFGTELDGEFVGLFGFEKATQRTYIYRQKSL